MMKGLNIAVLMATLTFSSCSYFREQSLKNEGDQIIVKIESFKKGHTRLPDSLSDIGISTKEEGPIYYLKTDDMSYKVWFGTGLGESVTYDSEKREWSP
jgi:hypothetical protein